MSSRPVGRPANADRATAILLGDRVYSGKRCRKCNGTQRYTSSFACVACTRDYQIEARRLFKAAKRRGAKTDIPEILVPDEADDFLNFSPDPDRHTGDTPRTHCPTHSKPLKLQSDTLTRPISFSKAGKIDDNQSGHELDFLECRDDFEENEEQDQGHNAEKLGVSALRQAETAAGGDKTKSGESTSDPEPICPDCGCPCEADYEPIAGWLRRTSPWRCTICEWEDAEPAPEIST